MYSMTEIIITMRTVREKRRQGAKIKQDSLVHRMTGLSFATAEQTHPSSPQKSADLVTDVICPTIFASISKRGKEKILQPLVQGALFGKPMVDAMPDGSADSFRAI
jgi:hypothetical protein